MSLPSSPRYGARILWVTLHTAEGARTVDSLYGFFDRNQNASSHAGADGYQLSGSWVPDERSAWTLLNGNPRSLNLEMCGFARWSRAQWLSEGWVDGVWNPRQMIRNAAAWARQKCDAHEIPRRLLTAEQVGRGESGIIDHARYTFGTGDGDHTDVGDNFPWDVFFADLQPSTTPAHRFLEDVMFIRNLQTDQTAVLSGGIVSGVDNANADATNHNAGGALMVGVGQAEWDDMVAKSQNLETLGQKLDAILAALTTLNATLIDLTALTATSNGS